MTMKSIIRHIAALAVLAVGLVSCAKDVTEVEKSVWEGGTEETQVDIYLRFSRDASECAVSMNIQGVPEYDRKLKVEWKVKNVKFIMYDEMVYDDGDLWEGSIENGCMTLLQAISGTKYKLYRRLKR